MLVIIVASVLFAFSYGGYRQFNQAVVVKKAAGVVGSDVALVRSMAIERRANVSLVATESERGYVIRDTSGVILARRSFDFAAALPLDLLNVETAGDSLTFNSRGLLVSAGSVQITIGRGERQRTVQVNALGRYKISNRL